MNHKISLDDDTSELLQAHAALTGLPIEGIIDRLLSAHLSAWRPPAVTCLTESLPCNLRNLVAQHRAENNQKENIHHATGIT